MKKKHYFATSLTMWIGLSIMILFSYGCFFLVLFFSNDDLSTAVWLGYIFFTIVLPTIIPFTNAQRFFSVIRLDNDGVTQLLFGFIKRRYIKWEEVTELRTSGYMGAWIFFSKRPLENFFYDDIVKRKDVIQAGYSEKLVSAIREYTNMSIIGYDD